MSSGFIFIPFRPRRFTHVALAEQIVQWGAMKIDLYTKAVLTGIAVLLTALALRPGTVVQAQGSFTGVQFAVTPVGYSFFDSRTGEVWEYNGTALHTTYRVPKLGQPLVKDK